MDAPDELFSLRTQYYIGNYQAAIQEASYVSADSLNDDGKTELAFYLGLAKVAAKEDLDDVDLEGSPELEAIASFANGTKIAQAPSKRALYVKTLQLVNLGDFSDALKGLAHADGDLELLSLRVQIYLKIDRADLAQKDVAQMMALDDDHTLSQMSQAYVCVSSDWEHKKEAAFVFKELIEKWHASALLVNALACALIHLERYEEASEALKEFLDDSSPSGKDLEDTRANLHVVETFLGTAKGDAPAALARASNVVAESFDSACARYAPSVK